MVSADMTSGQDPEVTMPPLLPRARSADGDTAADETVTDLAAAPTTPAPGPVSGSAGAGAAADMAVRASADVAAWRLEGFEELHELGRGGYGRVVAARHGASGTLVAIKYLSPALTGEPQFREAFRAEAVTLRGLSSPFITRFFDYVEEPAAEGTDTGAGGAAIVMELVPGVSLRALLKRGEPLPPEAALLLLKGSLLGLAVAHHAGIVHRDYKPENVLVLREGGSKLSDFGIAVRAGDHTAASVGTAAYLAPELWRGEPPTTRCDIYAATVTFYECVTGRRPYPGSDPLVLGPAHLTQPVPAEAVPPQVRSLVLRGLAKEPAQRPDHALSFLAELEATAVQAYGPAWEERGRQRLAILAAAGLAALGLGAIPALSLLFGGGATAVGGGAAATAGAVAGASAGAGAGSSAAATQVAQGAVSGARAGRRLLRARHLLKLGTTGGKVVAAVTVTAVVAGGVAVGVHEVNKPKPQPAASGTAQGGGGSGAGTAWKVSYRTADQSIPVPGNPSYPDAISTRIPVIAGMADPALQARVNALLAKPILDAVAENRKALASSKASENSGLGYGFNDAVSVTTAGKLLYVRYTLDLQNGTGDGTWITPLTLLLRTDTWQQVSQAQLRASGARNLSTAAATKLAGQLSANLVFDGGPGCFATADDVLYQNSDGTPFTSGGSEIDFDPAHPAKLELAQATFGVTPAGYEFRYTAGLLSHACESASGLIPFAALTGIADPSIVALARDHATVNVAPPAPQLVQTFGGTTYVNADALRAGLNGGGGFHAAGTVCALVSQDLSSAAASSSGPNCYQLTMEVDSATDVHARWTDPAGTAVEEYLVDGVWYLSSSDPQAAFPGLSAGELAAVAPGQFFTATPAELDEIANQGANGTSTDDFSLLTVSQLLELIDPGGSATVRGSTAQGADTVIDCSAEQDTALHETLTVRTADGAPLSVADPQQGAQLQFSGYGAVPAISAPGVSAGSS